jgi:hypothetical protein
MEQNVGTLALEIKKEDRSSTNESFTWNERSHSEKQQSEDKRNISEDKKVTDDIKEHQKWRCHVDWTPVYRLPRRVSTTDL